LKNERNKESKRAKPKRERKRENAKREEETGLSKRWASVWR